MTPTDEQVQTVRRDFERITGKTFNTFYCPIMHEDRTGVELIEGHILPQAVKTASRVTVIQRKDVDNHFGTALEPDMIDFVNLPRFTTSEIIGKVQKLKLVQPDGTAKEAFLASPKSNPPFPQVRVRDDGRVVSAPFVKTEVGLFPADSQFSLKGTFTVLSAAVSGAFIKAAYLALFRLLGYDWVFSDAGRFVAKSLRQFVVERATKANAGTYFASFVNPVHIFPPGFFPFNTIEDARIVFHFDENGLPAMAVWGVSALFCINTYTFMVTFPVDGLGQPFAAALRMYDRYMADWKLPQKMHSVGVTKLADDKNGFGIHPYPLPISYLTKAEFREAKAAGVTTGWE